MIEYQPKTKEQPPPKEERCAGCGQPTLVGDLYEVVRRGKKQKRCVGCLQLEKGS